ncbi:MAG TPA: hypothetical protein VG753_03500 [Candidatus Paceibacterota bacterium]|nr:hypothetical protein [Candidatus Paceibacterota bacterium]
MNKVFGFKYMDGRYVDHSYVMALNKNDAYGQIRDFLAKHPGSTFVSSSLKEGSYEGPRQQIEREHVSLLPDDPATQRAMIEWMYPDERGAGALPGL